jgi:hypothetical protein
MHTLTRLLILLIAPVLACVPKVTVPPVINGSIQPVVIPPIKHTATWIFSPINSTQRYHSITKTRFQLDDSNQTDNQDSLSTITDFSATIDQLHTPLIITGHVDNILTNSGPKISTTSQKITLPITFSGAIVGGKVTLNITSSSATSFNHDLCSTPAEMVLGDIRTAITTVPSLLQLHSTWSDTITTTTCIGKTISADLEITRSYTVLGETDYTNMSLVLIRRLETTHINGTGTQGQHQIIIDGQGSGVSNFYLNPITGLIVITEAHHDSRITINTSGHLQHFSQNVTQNITINP